MGGDEYINKMDQQLPEATILLFRRLAHAKVMNFALFLVSFVNSLANGLMAGHEVAFVYEACILQGMNCYHISSVGLKLYAMMVHSQNGSH